MIGRQTFPVEDAAAELTLLAEVFESAPLADAMRLCAGVMRQAVRDNFTSSATPDNANWPPRKLKGDGHPLLIDTGALLQAATGGGAGHIEQIDAREVAMGVDGRVIPYAATHNYGRGAIPQREYAGLRPDHVDACLDLIADGLLQEIG